MSNTLQPHGLYSPPGSSVCGVLLARILEWFAIPSARGSSQPRDQTHVSCIAGRCFTILTTREALLTYELCIIHLRYHYYVLCRIQT